MKILCSGSAGFIGSHLVDALIKDHHAVIGIDNMSGGFKRNINPKSLFYNIDCHNNHEVENVMRVHKPQIVFHVSADATEGRSQFTPMSATQNNIMASTVVFTNAIKYGAKRIVFTSSMSVYGNQEAPFSEDMPRNPVDVYGVNKAATERILEILAKVHNVEYNIVRPHNVFGERQNISDPYRNVVGIFINKILLEQSPIIYGNGEQTRAFTHIDNLIPCLVRAGLDTKIKNEIFNIGPTEDYSINYLCAQLLGLLGSDLDPEYIPDRPLEVKHAYCTVDKAEKSLGYKTVVDFYEGLRRMCEWAKQLGPQPFKYLDDLEIVNKYTPKTWSDKTI